MSRPPISEVKVYISHGQSSSRCFGCCRRSELLLLIGVLSLPVPWIMYVNGPLEVVAKEQPFHCDLDFRIRVSAFEMASAIAPGTMDKDTKANILDSQLRG
jgi:hypothetical protein